MYVDWMGIRIIPGKTQKCRIRLPDMNGALAHTHLYGLNHESHNVGIRLQFALQCRQVIVGYDLKAGHEGACTAQPGECLLRARAQTDREQPQLQQKAGQSIGFGASSERGRFTGYMPASGAAAEHMRSVLPRTTSKLAQVEENSKHGKPCALYCS
jgi:hypothetical protein